MSSPHDPYSQGDPNSGGFPQQGPGSGGFQQPGPYGQPYVPLVATTSAQPRTNGLAVASMVVSIVGVPFMCAWIGFLLGILGVVFGHVAKGQIKREGTGGGGMATAGLVIGYCIIGLLMLLVVPLVVAGVSMPFLVGSSN